MKNTMKKLAAVVMAAVMTIGGAMTVCADEVTFTEVTYKFECTTFVAADTITLEGQAVGWVGSDKPTKDVSAAGAFEVKITFPSEVTGFTNLGFLASANSVANIYKLTGVVINGVEFTFQADATVADGKDAVYQTSTIDATSSSMNGFPNIWNAAGQQAVVAKSANGSTLNGGTEGITVTWADADLNPAPAPEPEPSVPVKGDMGVATYAILFVGCALVAVAVVGKKRFA